jgi:hypothetical protein
MILINRVPSCGPKIDPTTHLIFYITFFCGEGIDTEEMWWMEKW